MQLIGGFRESCYYIEDQIDTNGTFSRSHADNHLYNMNKHILPYFGKMKLDEITTLFVQNWYRDFTKEKKLSSTTANHIMETLRIMLKEAYRLDMIKTNPIDKVKLKKVNR